MSGRSQLFSAIGPIYVISRLVRFADFYPDSKGLLKFSSRSFITSCIYHTLFTFILIYVLVAARDRIMGSSSTVLLSFYATGLALLFFTSKVSKTLYERNRFVPLWRSVAKTVRKLELLNVPLEYGKIRAFSLITFVPTQIILIALVTMQHYVNVSISSSKLTASLFSLLAFMMENERTVICGQLCSMLITVRYTMKAISNKIDSMTVHDSNPKLLRVLATFHQDLCRNVREANRLYDVFLLLSFGVDFVAFVTYTQLIAYNLIDGKINYEGIVSFMWTMGLCFRILSIVFSSQSCMNSVSILKEPVIFITCWCFR